MVTLIKLFVAKGIIGRLKALVVKSFGGRKPYHSLKTVTTLLAIQVILYLRLNGQVYETAV